MATLRFNPENSRAESVLPVQETTHSSGRGVEKISVTLSLSRSHFEELAEALGQIEDAEGSELRTNFPSGWTIFWKIREGESRFFVAHPETDEWVATLALTKTHLDSIRTRMKDGTIGKLSSLEPISRVSNVEVALAIFEGTGN